jgi:signal transduction histidine kinase/CheY-like chemotaxis protein
MSYKIKILDEKQRSELVSYKNVALFHDRVKIYLATILPGLYFSVTDKLLNARDEKFLFIPPNQLGADYSPEVFDNIVYKKFELQPRAIPFDDKIFAPIAADGVVMGGLVCKEDHSDLSERQKLLDDFAVSEYFNLIFNINDQLAAGDSIAVQILNLASAHRPFDGFMRSLTDWLVEFMGGGLASLYQISGEELILRKIAGQVKYIEEMPTTVSRDQAKIFHDRIAEGRLFTPYGVIPDYATELNVPPAVRFLLSGPPTEKNRFLLTGFVPNFTSYSYALFFLRLKAILSGISERHFAPNPDWHRIFLTLDEYCEGVRPREEMAEFLYQGLGEYVNINRLGILKYNQLENLIEVEADICRGRGHAPLTNNSFPVGGTIAEDAILTGRSLFKKLRSTSLADRIEYQLYREGARTVLFVPIKADSGIIGLLSVCSPLTDDTLKSSAAIFEIAANYLGKLFSLGDNRRTIKLFSRQAEEIQSKLTSLENLRILGELASGVFHDLNNVLGAILGRCELAMNKLAAVPESGLAEKIARDIQMIEKSAVDSGEIINRLRMFSRARKENKRTAVFIHEIIDDSIEMIKPRWERFAHENGARIILKKDVPNDIKIMADPSGLREVFTNLLLNAIDALPKGGEISVSCRQVNQTANIALTDTGVGIPEDLIDKIFNTFFTTKGEKGTGLGLPISKEIIEAHGGEIRVNSIPGKGARFLIELPIYESKAVGSELKASPVSKAGGLRILIVEDRSDLKEALREALVANGFEVAVVASGEEAIMECGRLKYDVIISDLGLPGMDGLELATQIKAIDPQMVIILISGWEIEKSVAELQSRGVDGIIAKPFKIETALEIIDNLTRERESIDRTGGD